MVRLALGFALIHALGIAPVAVSGPAPDHVIVVLEVVRAGRLARVVVVALGVVEEVAPDVTGVEGVVT